MSTRRRREWGALRHRLTFSMPCGRPGATRPGWSGQASRFRSRSEGPAFRTPPGYLSGLSFQVAHRDLRSALEGMSPDGDGLPSAASTGLRPTAPTGGPLSALASRLDSLGEGGFPGAEGAMRDLRSVGWWSFNPDPSDPRFSRYAQTFLEAGRYLSAAGEPGSLAMLERAVQAARGSPAAEHAPAEHMSRIQEQILSGAFGEHQEPLARIFDSWRRGKG